MIDERCEQIFDNGYLEAVEEILQKAIEYECCPHCGNEAIGNHWCPKCREAFHLSLEVPEGFIQYLQDLRIKMYKKRS